MAKLLFFNIPAYGHVNPTLPVITELVKRGHHVLYYNSDTFEQALKGTGAEFRSYPNSSASEAELAKRIYTWGHISRICLTIFFKLLINLVKQ